MRFSVVAPNLNEEKYLPVFLSSLQQQNFKDFEVIIIDGGSTDNSLDIINSFKNKLDLTLIMDKTPNIGYIRNVGSRKAKGEILFHTSSDVYLEKNLLERIDAYYYWRKHPELLSLSGRTKPMGTSVISHLAYQSFDFLRFLMTISPNPLHKYRPSGNFTTIKKHFFWKLGGFPEVPINEDGYLGQKIDEHTKQVCFHLGFYVGHHVKRFEAKGGLQTVLFYIYVLGNMFPLLKPLLEKIELRSAKTFMERSDLSKKESRRR